MYFYLLCCKNTTSNKNCGIFANLTVEIACINLYINSINFQWENYVT